MSLELAPETETTVRQYAEQRGVTVDELLTRAFPPIQSEKDRVMALLHKWQDEYGLPSPPNGKGDRSISELLAEWDAEDALRTPEQIESDNRLWESLQNDRHPVEI